MPDPLQDALDRLGRREDLGRDLARRAMAEIMAGRATDARIGGYLMAMKVKGESPDEIVGSAEALREASLRLPIPGDDLLDTCGTGGDGKGTFNISTTVAFVLAAAGVRVAKHGNRSVSSASGSADLLEALGIRIEVEPDEAARLLDEIGLCFLYAPKYHPAMKHAFGPRRELGVRTLFNIVGPLANPARTGRQIVGVFHPDLVPLFAEVLSRLGLARGFVFHGEAGLDELTTAGPTVLADVGPEGVAYRTVSPVDHGFPPARLEDLRGGTAAENARTTTEILAGERGPRRDTVVFAAAHGLVAGGRAGTIEEGIARAAEAIDSGAAGAVLERLRRRTPWTP